jgi:citrate lyase beta subunit
VPERTVNVRISAASPEADLSAVVRPGVATIYYPRAESAEQIQAADALISELEKLRGIRPRTVEMIPLIESPQGVVMSKAIASSSARVCACGIGPRMEHVLDGDALTYATAQVELHARALGVAPIGVHYVLD